MLNEFLQSKGLTARESEVARGVASGFSNAEIGQALGITEKTVKFHLTHIYKRLEVKSRAQLIVLCIPYLGSPSKGETVINQKLDEMVDHGEK